MGDYGPETASVRRLIERAGTISFEQAVDLYQAHAARLLISGADAERLALARARRVATRVHLLGEFERARSEAVTAWRRRLPEVQGPWLIVGQAIGNAAGALVVCHVLEEQPFQILTGPWRQAMGWSTPVGPGLPDPDRARIAAAR